NEEPFLDLTTINPLGNVVQTGFVEQGLYSVAFHPDFENNGYFYVHYASLPFNGDGLIVRFQVDPESPDVMTAERTNETAKVIMRIDQPWYNHNGGTIVFGPDGYLYIGSGDGGWEGDPLQAGSDLATWLGKILRIDVDVPDDQVAAYAIPPDNPFAEAQKERLMSLFGITEEGFAKIRVDAKPEIWAYGVRNPYEFSFDLETGDLWIADVGQNHWEEIIFQPADSEGGEYYGWPEMEAAFCHPITEELPQPDCAVQGILPVSMYPHGTAWPDAPENDEGGCSVQGLGVASYGGMEHVYLTGDWCSGRLFGTAWDGSEWVIDELLQTGLQFTAGGYDEQGRVLAVNANNFYIGEQGAEANPPGALWRVVPASEVPEGAEVAETVE
ncbi:MAG TPA: PQQ-dependent sugar dehydrogenase, partial [Pararhizobium sp.]|nr:PQQ-dependent sugar dehydrogenase [Pararhizobium sp.]